MAKTIRATFMGGHIELLEKSEIPEGAELTVTFETARKVGNQSTWAQVAEEISSQGNLMGKSEEINKFVREFRDNFSL
ncbi:MAG: antitoxin family protein [Candidatus Magnetominusculus sp. LBB02]|nr:antitoxin family protein [Candidatus Magnetominusculus sp. LBB02]